jgi:predicted AlkP superfamily pyrophosphatase or phosphodiesterase
MENGTVIKDMQTVYPSMTYPSHTALITGTYPIKNGIVHNLLFQPFKENMDYYSSREQIKTTTLYDLLRKEDHKVGSVLWPVTGKANINYNLPEIQAPDGENQTMVILENGTPEFLLPMEFKYGELRNGTKQPELDNFAYHVFLDMFKNHAPTLSMLHLVSVDDGKHLFGIESDVVKDRYKLIDDQIGGIINLVIEMGLYETTTFVITGDHGQTNAHNSIDLNVELVKMGLITLGENGLPVSYKAYIKSSGGSAVVYFEDEKDLETRNMIDKLIHKYIDLGMIFKKYDKSFEEELNLYIDGTYILEASEDYCFGTSLEGDIIKPFDHVGGSGDGYGGEHGYLPQNDSMKTMAIFSGNGIITNEVVESCNIVDISPTIANLFGLKFENIDGKVIEGVIK